jgi:hypothetical protein
MREAVKHHVPLTVMSVHPAPARPATRIYWAVPTHPENSFDPELARMAVQEFVDKVASEIGGTPEVDSLGLMAEDEARASWGQRLRIPSRLDSPTGSQQVAEYEQQW